MTFIHHVHNLLVNQCTRSDDTEKSVLQKNRYIERVRNILVNTKLKHRTEQEIWELGWDKPFYQYNRAATVGPAVDKARRAGFFNDRSVIASTLFMEDGIPGQLVIDATTQEVLTGACKVIQRLEKVQAYAQAVPRITEAVNRFHSNWESGNFSAEDIQEQAVSIAQDIGVGGGPIGKVTGFGFTTACHLLADLGLPIFKPDIWVCRIATSLPGVQNEIRRTWRRGDAQIPFDFLESKLQGSRAPDAYRRIIQPVMNALIEESQALIVNEFDLNPAFTRARFIDWTVVHFAISAETESFGLQHRPIDILCDGTGDAPEHIRAIAKWLVTAQASLEAENLLINARKKLDKAETQPQRERAQVRLARLTTNESQVEREKIKTTALNLWSECENTANSVGWQLAARYPDGFAASENSSRWKYINAARRRGDEI